MLLALVLLSSATGIQTPASPKGKIWVRGDFSAPPAVAGNPQGSGQQPVLRTSTSYPVEALLHREQGKVVAGVTVGVDGKATRCWIMQSSGSSALDQASCRIAFVQMRWTPGQDDSGTPIESEVKLPVTWKLPN